MVNGYNISTPDKLRYTYFGFKHLEWIMIKMEAINQEIHGEGSFSLILLGTNTTFTLKEKSDKNYPKGESLSVVATQIKTNPNQVTQKDDEGISELIKNEVEVIKGPSTLGSEVGDRIGRGLASLLKAISRGQTTLNILGHSRGAVQGILIAHELNELQKIIGVCESLDEMLSHLKKQQDERVNKKTSNTNDFISILKKKIKEHPNQGEFFENLKFNCPKASLNFFLMDPVPGDVYPVTWYDARFYTLPLIVKNAEIIYYENERSDRGFTPIYISGTDSNQKITLLSMPGHHGTGSSGNNKSQQGYDVQPKDKKATHVQKLIVYKILHFLQQQGVELKEDLDLSQLQLRLGRKYVEAFKKGDFPHIYRSLYAKIQENSTKYLAFNNTNYPYMGLLEYRRLLKKGIYEKYHHTFFANHGFVNEEHLQLMMDDFFSQLGVSSIDISNLDQVVKKVHELLVLCIKNLAEEKTLESQPLLSSKIVRQNALNVYGVLIQEISQKYLMMGWALEVQQKLKTRLFDEVKEMLNSFKTLSNEDQKNNDVKEFALELIKKSKLGLTNTMAEQAKDLKSDFEKLMRLSPDLELEDFFTRIYLQLTQKPVDVVEKIFKSKEFIQMKDNTLDEKIKFIWSQIKDTIPKEKSDSISIDELETLFNNQFGHKLKDYEKIQHRLLIFIEDVKALGQLENIEFHDLITFKNYESELSEAIVTQTNKNESKLSFLRQLKFENLVNQSKLGELKEAETSNNTLN